jgi:hypothetical protein
VKGREVEGFGRIGRRELECRKKASGYLRSMEMEVWQERRSSV